MMLNGEVMLEEGLQGISEPFHLHLLAIRVVHSKVEWTLKHL